MATKARSAPRKSSSSDHSRFAVCLSTYQFVLVTVVLTTTFISIFIAKKNTGTLTTFQVILDENGVCSFENVCENAVDNTDVIKEQFQLLASSRCSFFGCWLHMAPLSPIYSSESLPKSINKRHKKKQLFIYRDSLNSENFSQLSQVIRKLKDAT